MSYLLSQVIESTLQLMFLRLIHVEQLSFISVSISERAQRKVLPKQREKRRGLLKKWFVNHIQTNPIFYCKLCYPATTHDFLFNHTRSIATLDVLLCCVSWKSLACVTNTGAQQGCVPSPFFKTSPVSHQATRILACADDTAFLGFSYNSHSTELLSETFFYFFGSIFLYCLALMYLTCFIGTKIKYNECSKSVQGFSATNQFSEKFWVLFFF